MTKIAVYQPKSVMRGCLKELMHLRLRVLDDGGLVNLEAATKLKLLNQRPGPQEPCIFEGSAVERMQYVWHERLQQLRK